MWIFSWQASCNPLLAPRRNCKAFVAKPLCCLHYFPQKKFHICPPTEPYPTESDYLSRLSISVSQWLQWNFHQRCLEPTSRLEIFLAVSRALSSLPVTCIWNWKIMHHGRLGYLWICRCLVVSDRRYRYMDEAWRDDEWDEHGENMRGDFFMNRRTKSAWKIFFWMDDAWDDEHPSTSCDLLFTHVYSDLDLECTPVKAGIHIETS